MIIICVQVTPDVMPHLHHTILHVP